MANAFGPKSLRELRGVHPAMVEFATRTLALSPIDFAVQDGLRTEDEQRELVAKGASQTMNSKHRKQADGFGHAVDLVPVVNGKPRWEWPLIYPMVAAARVALDAINKERRAKGQLPLAIRWGGVWDRQLVDLPLTAAGIKASVDAYVKRRKAIKKNAFLDGPHFELVSA